MIGTVCSRRHRFALFLFLIAVHIQSLDLEHGIEGDFWVELEPVIGSTTEYPLSLGTASRIALEEAQHVFSAMVYGFAFVYTPYDSARQVDEIFTLELHAEIPWADEGLRVSQTQIKKSLFKVLIRYFPSGHQVRWMRMMGSNIYHSAQGRGRGNLFKGADQKLTAIDEAIKDGIRNYLRPRILNKPKEVRGSVVLDRVPYIVIDEGQYVASVSIKIDVDEIIPYRVY